MRRPAPAPAWRDEAACRGTDPSLFYPKQYEPQDVDGARQVCDDCPVADECLATAIANHELFGVWGGMTPRQRRVELRRRRDPAAS